MNIQALLPNTKKFFMIFGLEYSVLWSVIIYFIWDDGPFIFTILDAIAGIFVIYAGYRLFLNRMVVQNTNYLLAGLIFLSLVYNSAWTVVIMLFLEFDLAGMGLPLDLISLSATGSLAFEIWLEVFQPFFTER